MGTVGRFVTLTVTVTAYKGQEKARLLQTPEKEKVRKNVVSDCFASIEAQ